MELTPKEKAKEIFDKMYFVDDPMGNYPMCFETAKQCALIAVDEIENQLTPIEKAPNNKEAFKYWKKVKEELLKIK